MNLTIPCSLRHQQLYKDENVNLQNELSSFYPSRVPNLIHQGPQTVACPTASLYPSPPFETVSLPS